MGIGITTGITTAFITVIISHGAFNHLHSVLEAANTVIPRHARKPLRPPPMWDR